MPVRDHTASRLRTSVGRVVRGLFGAFLGVLVAFALEDTGDTALAVAAVVGLVVGLILPVPQDSD